MECRELCAGLDRARSWSEHECQQSTSSCRAITGWIHDSQDFCRSFVESDQSGRAPEWLYVRRPVAHCGVPGNQWALRSCADHINSELGCVARDRSLPLESS